MSNKSPVTRECHAGICESLEVNPLLATRPINKKLAENNYFFSDLIKDAVALYDSGKCIFAKSNTITQNQRADIAQEELEYWVREGDGFFKIFKFCLKEDDFRKAAFNLHQATESYCAAIVLVFENYKPKTHNLTYLRGKIIRCDERFKNAFPNHNKQEKQAFHLLKRAYIDSRYKKNYAIALEDLKHLAQSILLLRELTLKILPENIKRLRGGTR